MGQPTQRATNYTARSNIEPAQIFLHANGQSAPRSGGARDVGRGAGSHTPSTASESFSPTARGYKITGYITSKTVALRTDCFAPNPQLGLYTISPLPKVYGVWHTKGKPGGGRILRKGRAIVLQPCEQCRWAGQYQGDVLVQESFGANEYLAKANPQLIT